MTRDVKIMRDGFTTLERGMDSGRDPSLLKPNQMAFGINTTVRGGFVSHRPGYRKLSLEFGDSEETRFTQRRWQGAKYFKPLNGEPERIVCCISGRQFVFVPDQANGEMNSVQEITPERPDNTTTSASFVIPAVGANVQVTLASVGFLHIGESILIDGNEFEVVSVDNAIHVTVENIDGTEGETVASGSTVKCMPHSDVNNAYRWQVWMEQAEDFLIIQDGQSAPIIYNGSAARRAADDEVPTGTVMAYGLGRLWVARGREFIASDIVGGPSGTDLYSKRDAVLHFTENDYIAEGGAFLAPAEVTGMAFPSNLDTSLGQGELVVFTQGGAVTVNVPASRDDWKNLSIPLQRVSLKPYGATGQNNIVEVNGDFWFRAKDGIRSFVMAQRQFGEWGNTPMSSEMSAILDAEDETLFHTVSGVLFDNRLLMTCVGQRDFDRGNYYMGLVALDFHLVSGMFERLPPAYDGLWTGVNILQVVAGDFRGVSRCFAFVLNDDREIEVWELTKKDIVDRPASDLETRIKWEIIPRSMGFDDAGDSLKRLCAARVWADKIRGVVQICAHYRPDQYKVWQEWECSTKRATKQWCVGENCVPQIPLEQHRTKIRFPQLLGPDDELSDGKPMNQGFEFQTKLVITGSCRIRRMRVKAEIVQEEQDWGGPESDSDNVVVTGCRDSYFNHRSNQAGALVTGEGGTVLTTESGISFIT